MNKIVSLVANLILLPRNVFILFIMIWRKLISPLYGDVCRYYPSCSSYGLQQVQQRGVIIGGTLTFWRILRCNPWSHGGSDPVAPAPTWMGSEYFRVTPSGFVIGTPKKGN